MTSRRARPFGWFALGLIALLLALVAWKGLSVLRSPRSESEKPVVAADPALVPPVLLVAKPADGAAVLAWQRFLAADGSPREDVTALADMVSTLLQAVPPDRRPALGFNEDLTRVLSSEDFLGDAALPATHPALRNGQLIDRWGRPWLVHPLAGDLIQVRSAGPDGKLFTADDLVAPKDATPEPASEG